MTAPRDLPEDAFAAAAPELQAATLQMAEQRRGQTDMMMWQVPALALTAQAFLLSISLQPGSTGLARALSAIAGLIVVAASLQLMLKHRYHEILYAEWLTRTESAQGLPSLHHPDAVWDVAYPGGAQHPWKVRSTSRNPGVKPMLRMLRRRAVGYSSIDVWTAALLALLVIDLFVLVVAILTLTGTWAPL